MFRCALFVLLSGVTLCGSARSADDWPQWANPEHWEFLGALTFEAPKLRQIRTKRNDREHLRFPCRFLQIRRIRCSGSNRFCMWD